jgi:hypothetical protein
MEKLPPVSMSSPEALFRCTLVVAAICFNVGVVCGVTSKEVVDEIEESSSDIGAMVVVSATVTIPSSTNRPGKSWKVRGENVVSQSAISNPGGGGPRVVKLLVDVSELDSSEKLSLLTDESSDVDVKELERCRIGGRSKRVSEEDASLTSSGAETSVVNVVDCCCRFCLMSSSIMSKSRVRCSRRCCWHATHRLHLDGVLLTWCRLRAKVFMATSVGALDGVIESSVLSDS